ncbi:unnamed protein product [Anisakis simplex]|uniref:Uncharacterized protein n=1 Tax=Anisakis simplex TaxID=6269 RepID=A0A0M3KF87_ANISI|nr:unnamed protein product [Anisakis simplex]
MGLPFIGAVARNWCAALIQPETNEDYEGGVISVVGLQLNRPIRLATAPSSSAEPATTVPATVTAPITRRHRRLHGASRSVPIGLGQPEHRRRMPVVASTSSEFVETVPSPSSSDVTVMESSTAHSTATDSRRKFARKTSYDIPVASLRAATRRRSSVWLRSFVEELPPTNEESNDETNYMMTLATPPKSYSASRIDLASGNQSVTSESLSFRQHTFRTLCQPSPTV